LWLFEDHVLGFLVFTESKKNGLTQALIAREFAKLDLAYQLRFHPVAELHLGRSNPLAPFTSTRKRQIYKKDTKAVLFARACNRASQERPYPTWMTCSNCIIGTDSLKLPADGLKLEVGALPAEKACFCWSRIERGAGFCRGAPLSLIYINWGVGEKKSEIFEILLGYTAASVSQGQKIPPRVKA
jgi:hypothetical protein